MTSLTTRTWLTALTLVLLHGGGFLLLQRAVSAEARPLRKNLADFPASFGQWQGTFGKMDERVAVRVGARDSIDRVFTNTKTGQRIMMHLADWETMEEPTLPHPPLICYPANGATILQKESVQVGGPDDAIQADLILVETGSGRSQVLYWYHWDEFVCTTRTEAMWARLRLLTRAEQPPVVKVLLETPAGPDQSRAELIKFATLIRAWTKDL